LSNILVIPNTNYWPNMAGFSLHAGVMNIAPDRDKLERLCRYLFWRESCSGVSERRLAITTYTKVRYPLKTHCRDVTTGDRRSHVIFKPLDLVACLAAPVPKIRVNLTRFYAVFVRHDLPSGVWWPSPNSRHRETIKPAKRNKAKQLLPLGQEKIRAQKHQSLTWEQRLKRVFGIKMETCEQCVGAVIVIASIDKSTG
jgi:hypothetical protein